MRTLFETGPLDATRRGADSEETTRSSLSEPPLIGNSASFDVANPTS